MHGVFAVGFIDFVNDMAELAEALPFAVEEFQLFVGVIDAREAHGYQA